MRSFTTITALLATLTAFSVSLPDNASADPPTDTPRMYFADDVSGRPFSKDPAVVKFNDTYWLYYDFSREKWTQLNLDGPILAPAVPTALDEPDLDLAWEKRCIEAAAMARRHGRLYLFYAGGYNNDPQQIGVAVSDDGVNFKRLFAHPFVPNGPPGSWNSSESGHPFLFQDDDGQDYLFYQGNNTNGRTWHLSVLPIDWKEGNPVLAPEKLPPR